MAGEGTLKNGKAEGINKEYYENGSLKAETPYKNDKKEGVEKFYRVDGTLFAQINYQNGKAINGKCSSGKVLANTHLDRVHKDNNPILKYVISFYILNCLCGLLRLCLHNVIIFVMSLPPPFFVILKEAQATEESFFMLLDSVKMKDVTLSLCFIQHDKKNIMRHKMSHHLQINIGFYFFGISY